MRGLCWWRPLTVSWCAGGGALAGDAQFQAQAELANEALAWYRQYVELHRSWHSGRTPTALVTFCGQGGVSEGVRRSGGAAHGQDLRPQERYVARYGEEAFTMGDSCSPTELRALQRATRSVMTLASPPCKAHSTARMRGEASEPPLIGVTRDALVATTRCWAIENVTGARAELSGQTTLLRGAYFGLHVDRPRLWETSFELHVDEALRVGGLRLRRGCCLGYRRRWRRVDPFGRPEMRDCCDVPNLWAVQGDKPLRCTAAECAWAMGLDGSHMDYVGMTQAVPPVYGQWVFAQACMRELEREFGISAITFDEFREQPERSRRQMRHWLRGAGGPSPDQGVELVAARQAAEADAAGAGGSEVPGAEGVGTGAEDGAVSGRGAGGVGDAVGGDGTGSAAGSGSVGGDAVGARAAAAVPAYAPVFTDGREDAAAPPTELTVGEAEARELEYSWAGEYDRVSGRGEALGTLQAVRPMALLGRLSRGLGELVGGNALLVLGADELRARSADLQACCLQHLGTRVTVEARGVWAEGLLRGLGYALVRRVRRGVAAYASEVVDARSARPRSYWAVGRVHLEAGESVDYERAEASMDERDRTGAPGEPKSAKAARSYVYIPWEPERWDVGLPAEVDSIMARRGVGIYPVEELGPSEIPFYKWANAEGLLKSVAEADRALLAGAMEYVPEHRVAEVLASSTVHPWTIVDQGGGKWRLCHDYSVGTNKQVPTAPFSLPSVWDVGPRVRPGSYFAKYDIRDGFWHMPIGDDSRKRLVVRHPGTGRLIWASRLPFGYLEAPRLFCALTEALMQRLRVRAAGKGIHFYVFVDDVLCVGDDEALAAEGCQMLEAEFAARGVQWAPHKKRGPCQCIEFLGLLLCNVEGMRGITLTQKRLRKLMAELRGWAARRVGGGSGGGGSGDAAGGRGAGRGSGGGREEAEMEVEPRELASLLGKLVFASQVVAGGRTYMQGMLSAFKGLVVDWRRGAVAPSGGEWGVMTVGPAFWRDVDWWLAHLERRSLAPFERDVGRAEAVLAGTDASGWGTGQVLWLDGGREEFVLRFNAAEKRRPINWRELLGIVRACEMGGARLRGRTILVETDNMAARGAAGKLSSKAADMQEQIRRLFRLSERHGFRVRVTHTPGEKLDRPDQTSRGDAAEEPRARMAPEWWGEVEARWGPFDQFLGAERELSATAKPREASGAEERIWAHPTTATVGTALRRVGERLARSGGHGATALVLVPEGGPATWAGLLRHGLVVGRVAEGEEALEMNVLGRWQRCRAQRASRLVLFPRVAGATVRRLELTAKEGLEVRTVARGSPHEREVGRGEGYIAQGAGGALRLPVMPGSFMYSLSSEQPGSGRGCLYRVGLPTAEEGGAGVLVGQEGLFDASKAARRQTALPVFEVRQGAQRWRPAPRQMWAVDHLVEELSSNGRATRVSFDFVRANREIAERGGGVEEEVEWEALSPAGWWDHELDGPGVASGYSPFVPSEPQAGGADADAGGVGDWLEQASEQLERLRLSQCAAKTGSEGRILGRGAAVRGGELEGETGQVRQPCQYALLSCAGCHVAFALGETMVSHGTALVHASRACEAAHDAEAAQQVQSELAAARAPTLYYGVYSDEVGASGVYVEWDEVARLVQGVHGRDAGAVSAAFAVFADAVEFVRARTLERAQAEGYEAAGAVDALSATEMQPGGARLGSVTKAVLLREKLSDARIGRILECIAGRCGHARDDGMETACRRGCARTLHVESCAQLGRGYAALGNFACPECRLADEGVDPTEVGEASPLRRTVVRTMVLELGQGKETTTAGYAEYVRLEERYVLGMGQLLDGGMLMPRHSASSFKNFVTWFVLDADRACSLESMVRSAGAFLTKVPGLTDWTKDASVKAHVKELLISTGVEHEPATTATPRMLKLLVEQGGLIDERYPQALIAAREKVQVVCEGLGGCRIGEVAGGGDCHGLLANEVALMEDPSATTGALGQSVVLARLEHSKTGFARSLVMASKTETTGIEVANVFVGYWREAGMRLVTSVQAGVRVTRPDFWVVRVSLLGLDEAGMLRMTRALSTCGVEQVRRHAGTSARYIKLRYPSTNLAKKYVNIAGGGGADADVRAALGWAQAQGFEASLVPGPMLLATTGGKRPVRTLMPLSTASTFAPTKELLVRAAARADGVAGDPDPDLDVREGRGAKWSTHSLRRLADTTARRYREVTGSSEAEIDIFFGWNERVLLKAMQLHYASMSTRELMALAKVTGMM
jgi:hypothetical protein